MAVFSPQLGRMVEHIVRRPPGKSGHTAPHLTPPVRSIDPAVYGSRILSSAEAAREGCVGQNNNFETPSRLGLDPAESLLTTSQFFVAFCKQDLPLACEFFCWRCVFVSTFLEFKHSPLQISFHTKPSIQTRLAFQRKTAIQLCILLGFQSTTNSQFFFHDEVDSLHCTAWSRSVHLAHPHFLTICSNWITRTREIN